MGFCIPEFMVKGENVWFTIDNIDWLIDAHDGKRSFNGTVLVANQRVVNCGESMYPPLNINKKLNTERLWLDISFMNDPIIRSVPIRFKSYDLTTVKQLSKYSDIWYLCSYFSSIKQTSLICEDQSSPVMPTWSATQSLIISKTQYSDNIATVNTEVVAPLLKSSPTDYATLYTALMMAQGFSTAVVGEERKTVITLDLDLYFRALHIQQTEQNSNWILCAGTLHIVFASLHALGKTIEGSGLDMCTVESGIYSCAALRKIHAGKGYKRGMEYHIVLSLAIMLLRFDAFFSSKPSELEKIVNDFITALHQRDDNISSLFEKVERKVSIIFSDEDIMEASSSGIAKYFIEYVKQVKVLLAMIEACRSGDFISYLEALEQQIKYVTQCAKAITPLGGAEILLILFE